MTLELSRFVHSFDDALAELGAGHHGRPDPLVCWTTLEARSRQKKNWSRWRWKRLHGVQGNSSETSFDKQRKANGLA